jgi:hypothetical protein
VVSDLVSGTVVPEGSKSGPANLSIGPNSSQVAAGKACSASFPVAIRSPPGLPVAGRAGACRPRRPAVLKIGKRSRLGRVRGRSPGKARRFSAVSTSWVITASGSQAALAPNYLPGITPARSSFFTALTTPPPRLLPVPLDRPPRRRVPDTAHLRKVPLFAAIGKRTSLPGSNPDGHVPHRLPVLPRAPFPRHKADFGRFTDVLCMWFALGFPRRFRHPQNRSVQGAAYAHADSETDESPQPLLPLFVAQSPDQLTLVAGRVTPAVEPVRGNILI